jgi:hypothetical protein
LRRALRPNDVWGVDFKSLFVPVVSRRVV